MLFHAPDGASGTFERSVESVVDVGSVDADVDGKAGSVAEPLAPSELPGEALEVAARHPPAANAMTANTTPYLRQIVALRIPDSTSCPSFKFIGAEARL
jgi:hypothetical protein